MKLVDRKAATLNLGVGLVMQIEQEIAALKAGALDDSDAVKLIKMRANQVSAVNSSINDDKLSFRLAVAENGTPGIAQRSLDIGNLRKVTRGLSLQGS